MGIRGVGARCADNNVGRAVVVKDRAVDDRPLILRVPEFLVGVVDADHVLWLERDEVADRQRGESMRTVAKPAMGMAVGVLLEDLDPQPLVMALLIAIRVRAVDDAESNQFVGA